MESEKRQMNFQREQNVYATTTPTEQTDIFNQEGKSDLIRWQQDLDDDLLELAKSQTGWTKVDETWIKTNAIPLCNDLFMADVVLPQCKPFMSRSGINSNLNEDRLLCMLRSTADDIADNMCDGFDKYGINFINYDVVLRLIKTTITHGAFRALEGWTKKLDSMNFKRVETSMDKPEQEKRSLFRI